MPTKRPRNMTRRQNRIHEIHAPQIAALRDMIVADVLKVPGTTLKIALAIQKRFKVDTPIFLSLETLAAECRVNRRTLFRHFPAIRRRWGIGFYTPGYSQRGAGFATEVSFPISRVEKYSKYADFCKSMGHLCPSFASYLSASKATLKAWAKMSQHTSEVAATTADAYADATARPCLATKENSHGKLGADFNGEWHKATQVEKPDWSDFDLDDDVRWPADEAHGFVIGFGITGSATHGRVLVSWQNGGPNSWVETAELEVAEPRAGACQADLGAHERLPGWRPGDLWKARWHRHRFP